VDVADTPTPELQTMTLGEYDLVEFALAGAGFALLAYTLYAWVSREELGARYRPSTYAGLCIGAVATLSYVLLFVRWGSGFDLVGDVYEPNEEARLSLSPRYVDWSVTVPLLTVELLAVCSIAGARARALRARTTAAAFLMILTGYLGRRCWTPVAAPRRWSPGAWSARCSSATCTSRSSGRSASPCRPWGWRPRPACATPRSCCSAPSASTRWSTPSRCSPT